MDLNLISFAWNTLQVHDGKLDVLIRAAPRIPKHILAEITRCWHWSLKKKNAAALAGRSPADIYKVFKSCT